MRDKVFLTFSLSFVTRAGVVVGVSPLPNNRVAR
jgi:hypothetical protein